MKTHYTRHQIQKSIAQSTFTRKLRAIGQIPTPDNHLKHNSKFDCTNYFFDMEKKPQVMALLRQYHELETQEPVLHFYQEDQQLHHEVRHYAKFFVVTAHSPRWFRMPNLPDLQR